MIHPWLASSTDFMYLYRVPWVTLRGGATQVFLRRSISSGDMCNSIEFETASIDMVSPS